MFIEKLLNSGNAPLLEQAVRFTSARAELLGENITNISIPSYRYKDLSVEKFHKALRDQVEVRQSSPNGKSGFDGLAESIGMDHPERNLLFHDRNNRSVEQLMSDNTSNALMHNLMTELLRKQFASIQDALKEKVT